MGTSRNAIVRLAHGLAVVLLSSCTMIATDELNDQTSCPSGTKPCALLKKCVPVDDPATGCGNPDCEPCNVSFAVATCNDDNLCAVGTCLDRRQDCNDDVRDGCEVDVMTNASKCGSCANVCPFRNNSNPSCTDGICGIVCSTGFGDCDKDKTNGCEVSTANDSNNCGECGNVCEGQTTCSGSDCK